MGRQDDNQQEQQRNSIDRVNAFIKKTDGTQKNLKRAKTAAKVGKTGGRIAVQAGRAAAQAAAEVLVATSEIWVPVGAIILGVVLIIIVVVSIFMFFIGTPPPTTAGEPSTQACESNGGTCESFACVDPEVPGVGTCTDIAKPFCCAPKSTLICDANDPATSLKQNFNITTVSTNKPLLKYICDVYVSAMSPHPNYLSLFRSTSSTFTFLNTAGPGGAFAITNLRGDVTFYEGFYPSGASFQKYILIHESGHVIAVADNALQNNLYNQTYNASLDTSCFNSVGILKTYPINVLGSPISARSKIHETFAESLADTLLCAGSGTCKGNGGGAAPIQNFPSTCSNIYNYITTRVLGG